MKLIIILCFSALISSLSHSEFINNGYYTNDSETSLNWLHLDITAGLSVDQVYVEIGAGGQFEGWRYATLLEAQSILLISGLNSDYGDENPPTSIRNGIDNLGNNFGFTFQNISSTSNGASAYGFIGDSASVSAQVYLGGNYLYDKGGNDFALVSFSGSSSRSKDYIDSTYGHFLVRSSTPSPVPVPTAAWLFCSALIGLAGIKCKK
ncbi:hypothetical protein [Oceanicoccus sp. KOV_DT_Chl]|uniref:hypothetical protein n=1 Tax=Oceanicoccus sp. KOV_DT_Chl TaxID=1904639 RepID=UPI000C7C3890|nr:hypothetical protein [Oceanicoccus sp. KOV_DT_Chl]